jgi:hypothetical protein
MQIGPDEYSTGPDPNCALVPTLIGIGVAAALAGLSPATFKERAILSGLVTLEDGRVRSASLAAWLGRCITIEEFAAADRTLDRSRRRQRHYAREQRGGLRHAPIRA